MKARTILLGIACFVCSYSFAQQTRVLDTTMKAGKAGYRVRCNNKKADKNNININPIGFESSARDADFEVKGRVNKAEVDDLNNDGFPDLLLYVINANDKNKGMVVGISSSNNEGMAPMIFPDIMVDQKLSVGYNGDDSFQLLNGMLLRSFPLYDVTDPKDPKPTTITRNVLYRVVTGERGVLKFVVLRSYDVDKSKK